MFKNLFKNTREKAEKAIDEIKEKTSKLSDSADKFLSDGNNQMKTIAMSFAAIAITMTISNIVSIVTNIHTAKSMKEPKVINNITIYKEVEKK